MGNRIDLTGMRFEKLTVIQHDHSTIQRTFWKCKCDCGNIVIYRSDLLKAGRRKSCGCFKPGGQPVHGMSETKIYKTWVKMKGRCNNKNLPDYERYGGRGITVCDEWLVFENFYKDMGDVPDGKSLDRINNNAGYSKNNCRWATLSEQANNKRNNHFLFFNNSSHTIGEWAKKLGIHKGTIRTRIKRNMPIEKVLSTKDMRYK